MFHKTNPQATAAVIHEAFTPQSLSSQSVYCMDTVNTGNVSFSTYWKNSI